MNQIEEGNDLQLDFSKLQKIARTGSQVVPVVVQDADSKEVLVVAYSNQQALEHSLQTGIATFWSTSRNELWIKGKTSGDMLQLVDVRVNCEQNSLLYLVRMVGGGVCHTKDADGKTRKTCYYRSLKDGEAESAEIARLLLRGEFVSVRTQLPSASCFSVFRLRRSWPRIDMEKLRVGGEDLLPTGINGVHRFAAFELGLEIARDVGVEQDFAGYRHQLCLS